MYNIIISLILGLATYAVIAFALKLAWWIACIAALAVFTAVFYLISRIIMKKIEAIMSGAMKDLQTQRVTSREMQIQLVDRAIKDRKSVV